MKMTGRAGSGLGAAAIGAVVAGMLLTACSSGSPSASTTTAGTVAAVKAAVHSFLGQQGVQQFKYVITTAEVSTADPTWAYVFVAPRHQHQADFQSFYGFAQKQGSGGWKVVADRSSTVGCPPGSRDNVVVPTAVLSEFQLSCPARTTPAA